MPDGATLRLVNWLIFSKICVFSVDYQRKNRRQSTLEIR